MTTIYCKCNNIIEKDYGRALVLLDDYGELWCVWVCDNCGQEFKDKTKEAVNLASPTTARGIPVV